MKKSVMKKWVSALRSGKFHKGVGELKYTPYDGGVTKYCCLGVACEIGLANPQKIDSYATRTFLPMAVQQKLAGMNDGGRHTFKTIADYIEKNYTKFTKEFGK